MEKPDGSAKPGVSVIIPAYNQAQFVTRAINSVLEQTYPNFELVVVDDGSTDETPQILAKILDPRVRVIRQENGGLSAARNTGLRNSSAPMVALLDSDDYFFPDCLAVLMAFLDHHPETGVVCGGVIVVDQKGNALQENIREPQGLELSDLLMGNFICVDSVMVRRKWFDRVGEFDKTLRACEDWDMWLRMAYAGCQFAWIEQPVVAYRYHLGQMTRESDRMRKAMIAVLDKFFAQKELPEYLKNSHGRAYASAYLHIAAYAFHANEFNKGKSDLVEAFHLDPGLKDDHYKAVTDRLVGWSNDPRSAEPVKFLERIIENAPGEFPGLKRELRRAMADVLLEPLFSGSKDVRRANRWDLLRAIQLKPDWMFNRGVIRMVLDAWLP